MIDLAFCFSAQMHHSVKNRIILTEWRLIVDIILRKDNQSPLIQSLLREQCFRNPEKEHLYAQVVDVLVRVSLCLETKQSDCG